MGKPANFSIVQETDRYILIRDEGPWDQHLTVTNDAEGVVERLASKLAGRRLFYVDSGDVLDELKVDDSGKFAGFAPGGPEKLNLSGLRLTLDIIYDLGGEPLSEMKQRLDSAVLLLMGEGLITGSTNAEISEYSTRIEEIKPQEQNNSEHFCPRCGQAWAVHNNDGSCVED